MDQSKGILLKENKQYESWELIDLLRFGPAGVCEFNETRVEYQSRGYDICLTHHRSFAGLKLKGINFSKFWQSWTNFDHADLSDADFSGADLKDSTFRNTNLNGAKFDGANLKGTCFWGAKNMSQELQERIIKESRESWK
ncbi:MAG: pentapeptide repeat-containing protein [bacterium]|nr:pentapeptide repeat-containing protein [bacterium]